MSGLCRLLIVRGGLGLVLFNAVAVHMAKPHLKLGVSDAALSGGQEAFYGLLGGFCHTVAVIVAAA